MSSRTDNGAARFVDAVGRPESLVRLLRSRALERPERPAYTFLADGEREESSLTYGQLDLRARAIAARLQSLDLSGQRVLLLYPPGLEYIAAFCGCLYAGAVAVPAYPPRLNRSLERLQTIVADAGASAALTTNAIHTRLEALGAEAPSLRGLKWVVIEDLEADDEAGLWREPGIGPSTLAFLQYTSGSTATPKGVMVSHGNLIHNEEMIRRAFRQSERSVIVGWLPLYHDMGLIGNVLQPLYVGARCVLMSPVAFLQKPLRWLQAITRYRATTSGGPDFAYEMCVRKTSAEERDALDLSSWEAAFNGSEPVRAETLERFARTFEPCGFKRSAFYPCYGLAEATLLVSGSPETGEHVVTMVRKDALEKGRAVEADADDSGRALVGCGGALLEQKVIVVDPDTRAPRAADEVGEVWVSGPSVAGGYWNRPEESERTFRAYLADTDEGPFLRTGDLGFMRDGELFITGRLKDLIIIRGRNLYPHDIERTTEGSHAALRPGCGVAFSCEVAGEERLVIVHEVERRASLDGADVIGGIRQSVAEEHEVQPHAVLLVRAGNVPKTSSGKLRRRAARDLYLSSGFEVLAGWSAVEGAREAAPPNDIEGEKPRGIEEISAYLRARLAGRLRVPVEEIDPSQPVTRYGVDSLLAVELTHDIEASLGVALPMASLLQGSSIDELATLAGRQFNGAEDATAAHAHADPRPGANSDSPATDTHPLSHGQQALWFLHQMAPESAAYNVVSAVRIRTSLDAPSLRRAFQSVVNRHPALRTTFESLDGSPAQRVREPVAARFEEVDAASWSATELNAWMGEQAHRPFSLDEAPLVRVSLLRRSADEYILLLVAHHIIVDFWSLAIMLREMGLLYTAERTGRPAELTPPRLPFADHVRRQTRMLEGAEGKRLLRFWEERLGGELPPLNLLGDRPRPPVQTYLGASHAFRLDAELTQKLKALGRGSDATLYTVLLAAFQVLLHRYTGQRDVAVGSPTSGRNSSALADVVGYFVNPIVLRGDLAGDPTFTDFLGRSRSAVLDALAHQDYPFPLLVQRLQPEREPSRSPLFQTMFVLQQAHLLKEEGLASFALGEAGARMELGELVLESMGLPQRVAQFDLTLAMAEVAETLAGSLEYNTDLFDAESAARMALNFETLLRSIAGDPHRRLSQLPLLAPAERRRLLAEWDDTSSELPPVQIIHRLFEEQAAAKPGAVALVAGEERVTYAELNARSNQLARYLRAAGVAAESRVGVCVGRSSELVVALLAVLKAGGSYVPLDPAYPPQRLAFMLEDAGLSVLLTQQSLLPVLPARATRVVCLDAEVEREQIAAHAGENLEAAVEGENLAYVIYTSGSTGRPKGVALTHRSAAVFLRWAREVFTPAQLEGVLASTSICFDLSVFELFLPLSCGGKIVLAENALHLPSLPAADEVTLVNTVPSAMAELVRSGGVPPSVRTVNLAGEPLPNALAQQIYTHTEAEQVWNLYGPSEDTTYSTYALVKKGAGEQPAIGRPVSNTQVYLLDEHLQPVPLGAAGELYLGGDGLARGYWARPDLTAERFVPNPFAARPGARMYRTGDLARYRDGGMLEYLGRVDQQVKVRGYRIELGEIETALRAHEAVAEAAVVARDDGGGLRLVAYLTGADAQGSPQPSELRRHLRESLPDYMTPAVFVVLDALPLTPNGKVDRKRLPAPPSAGAAEGAFAAPRNQFEEMLAGIWAEVLGVGRVGVADNFFDLGGHSLLATQVISRVRSALRVEVPLRVLFESPTVARLAESVEALTREGRGVGVPALGRADADAERPLSFAQQRLWFLDQLEPGRAYYNIPAAIRLTGPLDVGALARAIGEIVARHEVLRTRFEVRDGQPLQVIAPAREWSLGVVDLLGLPASERERELRRRAGEEARAPFVLSSGELLRTTLLRTREEGEHVLLLTLHHIAGDAWSLGVFVRELTALYEAFRDGKPSPLPQLPLGYADFALWQREHLRGEALESQLSYWRRQLAGAPARIELPTDRPRPAIQTFDGARQTLALTEELTATLKALGRREGATLFMTLLAAFQTLLYRYTGQEDIVVGSPVAGRDDAAVENLIGFFVNTQVLRTELSGDLSFREALARVREVVLEAHAHRDVPFERLVEELQPERSLSHTPLVQVIFALQNVPVPPRTAGGLTLAPVAVESETSKFDLSLSFEETAGALVGSLEYNTDLFDADTMTRLLEHFGRLLEAVAEDADRPLASLPLLSESERRRLLVEWNDTARPRARTECVHRHFERQAGRRPEAVAVRVEGESLTYGELNRCANRLARRLRKMGVGPEQLVAVCAGRSTEFIVAALASVKAGGAYLPLDPAHPAERLSFLLADSGARVLLTSGRLAGAFEGRGAEVVLLDSLEEDLAGEGAENLSSGVTPENLAYVIYTSGSTGRPKGVEVTHASLLNLVNWHLKAFGVTRDDRAAQLAGVGFDASVWELWPYLSAGASLHLPSEETRTSPADLRDWLTAERVTVAFAPTPVAEALIGLEWPGETALRVLLTGGDKLHRAPSAGTKFTLVNNYGPTESTVVTTSGVVAPRGEDEPAGAQTPPPIGRPIANVQVYILDERMEPVPAGVAGELYVGGESLARGYLRRAAMTAERFVPDPHSGGAGARLYRTGDLARYRADGEIEFLGRRDQQVKLRGYRIELGEIETVLAELEGVREAAVVLREEREGEGRLAAYVVADEGAALDTGALRRRLRETLPDYMTPAVFVMLDSLPLTPNGKVDRKALPAPDSSGAVRGDVVGPRDQIEEILAGIWSEVLGVGRVGVADNFFDLGGHSLLATQVISRLNEAFQMRLPLRALFESPTVARLAARVREAAAGVVSAIPALRATGRETAPLLSFAQQRLWFLEQWEPGNTAYNIPAAVRLTGRLDAAALERSIGEVLERHEALRTTFASLGGEPAQVIAPAAGWSLPVVGLEEFAPEAREAEALRLAAEEAARPFDLKKGPLLRARLLRLDAQDHMLLVTMHHIISDGWSMGVFVRELTALYEAFAAGARSPLAALPIQYADFARWQREWVAGPVLEEQLSYWRRQLGGGLPVLELPTDRPRLPVQTYRGAAEPFELSGDLSARLKALSRERGVTLYMTLLAAFQTLLYRYTGQEDIVVGSPVAGRTRPEAENLIGFFVNTLVLRASLGGGLGFDELLGRVREVTLDAHAHQDVPFETLVEELQPERSLSYTPLFQVMFVMENAPLPEMRLPGLEVRPVEIRGATSKFDLTLFVSESETGITGAVEFNTDLFDAATIRRMVGHFGRLLDGVVSNPRERLSELPLLGETEARQLASGWNDETRRDYARLDRTLHRLFERQVARTPDAVALVRGPERLTYRELNRRANKIASHLRRLGVGPEVLTGVMMRRSAELVAALLGVLKAGGAYVPLDPTYPAERLAFMLEDSRAPVLLTQASLADGLEGRGLHVVRVDADREVIDREGDENPDETALAENLAYVIYTSGSTGRPKGVAITHGSAATLVHWAAEYFDPAELAGVLFSTSVCFDLSIFELFVPLACGGKVLLADNALALPSLASADEVTMINTVPSAMSELVRSGGVPASALTVNLAGEPLKNTLVQHIYAQQTVRRVVNLYGPTEDTTYSTVAATERGSEAEPTIGRPVSNTQSYVLDQRMRLVPVGVAGELYLGGDGLARGYLARPELTAERFVPDPHSGGAGARLYRTGDLARRLPDGDLEYLGRMDHQVKIRGFRIELGEIEAVLGAHEAVRAVVVVARDDGRGERRLVAYVVPAGAERATTVEELRRHLGERLPDYMAPQAFVVLDSLPLTPNGKVDRRRLPAPGEARPELDQEFVAPRTPVEEMLAGIWSEVLGVARVGVHDNFFNLGGHSLLATRVVSRVEQSFEIKLSLRHLFETPTVAALTALIERGGGAAAGPGRAPKIEVKSRRERKREQLRARLERLPDHEAKRILDERKFSNGSEREDAQF